MWTLGMSQSWYKVSSSSLELRTFIIPSTTILISLKLPYLRATYIKSLVWTWQNNRVLSLSLTTALKFLIMLYLQKYLDIKHYSRFSIHLLSSTFRFSLCCTISLYCKSIVNFGLAYPKRFYIYWNRWAFGITFLLFAPTQTDPDISIYMIFSLLSFNVKVSIFAGLGLGIFFLWAHWSGVLLAWFNQWR